MFQRTSSQTKDRRIAPRSNSVLSAYLITPSGTQLRGTAKNLSRSGIIMETSIPPAWLVGETARLVFTLTEGNVVRLLRYSVVIVRESRAGLGLAFWRSTQPATLRQMI